MIRHIRLAALAGTAALLALGAQAQPYDPGADDDTIRIGNIMPYSGPVSAYSTIGRGMERFFDWVNDQGGVNGRMIEFITVDDGYQPPRTLEQTRRLVESDEVLFLTSVLGTPTNAAIREYMNEEEVPQLFAASGGSMWGNPEEFPWTMGWQPTSFTEGEIFAQYILDNVEDPQIAVLYQNDDFGFDYLDGFEAGLGDQVDDLIVASEPYNSTDPTVDSQVLRLRSSEANVFFIIATARFAAQTIRTTVDSGWEPVMLLPNGSASISATLEPAGLDRSTGVISLLYTKDPTDPQYHEDPDYLAWSTWMDEYYPEGARDTLNVLAFAHGHTIVQLLDQAGDELTRENIMAQAANFDDVEIPMLLDGITLNTGEGDYFPIEAMQMVRFNGETWEPFGDVISVD